MYQKKTAGGREDSSKFKASLAVRATQRGPVSKRRWEKGREERKNGMGRRRNGKGRGNEGKGK